MSVGTAELRMSQLCPRAATNLAVRQLFNIRRKADAGVDTVRPLRRKFHPHLTVAIMFNGNGRA